MPDWITHLGMTYMATATASRLRPDPEPRLEVRHLLLGTLLPDATRFTIILVDVLDWPAVSTFTYLIPFHSLLVVSMLAGALALLIPTEGGNSRRAFSFMMMGAAFHFLLDDIEGQVGCGSTTFYPLYFGKPINAWNSEGPFAILLLSVSAMALGAALMLRRHWPGLRLRLSRPRLLAAVVLVSAAGLLPLLFRPHMTAANAYYLDFAANPAAHEGQPVELCFSEVVAVETPTVEEFDRQFVLNTAESLRLAEWVSLRGIYQDGAIEPSLIVYHRGFADVTLSVLAAAVFLLLMVSKGGRV